MQKLIRETVNKHYKALGLKHPPKKVKVSILGIGESNQNYLVEADNKKFNFRKPFRSSNKCRQEFNFLKKLPKDIGPEPYYLNKDPYFSILSYIPGKPSMRWSIQNLKTHAKQLAKLHKERHKKKFSIYNRLLREIKCYDKKTLNHPDIKFFLPKVKAYVKDHEHLFNMSYLSRIHTDACVPNILINKNKLHYIDWEYSMIGDPAYDVAKLYFEDCSIPPWIIKLNDSRLRAYLNTYLKHRPDKTLKQRIKIWHVYIKFTDLLYTVWKLHRYEKEPAEIPKHVHEAAMNKYIKSLYKQFK